LTLPDGSRAAVIVRVPFHGSEIHTVLMGDEPHVVLRPTLEGVGVDYSSQLQKLRTRTWAKESMGQCATLAEDGKARSMATIGLDGWAMLLANIDENRVRANVKPVLIEFQKRSAQALRDYWAKGGAVNPDATDEQLDGLTDEIEVKRAARRALAAKLDLGVIEAMGTTVDPTWRESLARHTWAVYKGEAPDIAPDNRMLMAEPYLMERGISKADLTSIRSTFGKRLKAAYVKEYGREPEMTLAMVNGREREVKGYYERDRFLFDVVFEQYYSHLVGPMQLELGAA
jgi:hypothetical protein